MRITSRIFREARWQCDAEAKHKPGRSGLLFDDPIMSGEQTLDEQCDGRAISAGRGEPGSGADPLLPRAAAARRRRRSIERRRQQ